MKRQVLLSEVFIILKKLPFIFYYIAALTKSISRKYNEQIFILLNLLIYLIAVLIQIDILDVPGWLIIKSVDSVNLYQSVFQIQATISTLGIAVIGLISGFFSTKYYGITVTSYVLNIKPKILKHKLFVLFSLSVIALDFSFLSFELYNLVFAALISSILICIRMISDVFWAFMQGDSIKYEIHQYLLTKLKAKKYSYKQKESIEKVLYIITDDLEEAIKSNDIVAITDDLNAFQEIISNFTHIYSEHKYDFSNYYCLEFANDCMRAIECLLDSYQEKYIKLFVKHLAYTYNDFSGIKVHIDIWERVSISFFNIMKVIDPTNMLTDGSLRDLRNAIYQNITEEKETWESATHFLTALYTSMSNNQYYNQLSISLQQQYWKDFVYTDTQKITDYQCMTNSRFLTKPRSNDMFMLIKRVIDAMDKVVLSAIYPLVFNTYYPVNTSLMAYLYCKQNKYGIDSASIDYCRSILTSHHKSNYIYHLSDDILQDCEAVKKYLSNFEYFDSIDQMIPMSEILMFILLYILVRFWYQRSIDIEKLLNHFLMGESNYIVSFLFFSGDLDKFMKLLTKFEKIVFGTTNYTDKEELQRMKEFCEKYIAKLGLITLIQ